MRDINSVVVMGRLTKDPEYRVVGETTLANISLASGRGRQKDGTDCTDYFDVQYWGKGADAVRPYLGKGRQILVEGRLEQQRWDKDGRTQSRVIIRADNLQLCGDKAQTQTQQPAPQPVYSDNPYDEIPF